MDTRALLSLVTVADTGSFSRAAAGLGFTQSAVSQHIAGLEKTAGTPLLTRRPAVAPTSAGREFLRHARQILAHEQAARAAVVRVTGRDADRPVSVTVTPATEHLVPVGGPLAAVVVHDAAGAAAALTSGGAEVAVVDGIAAPGDPLPGSEADMLVRIVAEAPVGVLLPADHPLAGRPGLDLADLTDARWLDSTRTRCATSDLSAAARLRLHRGVAYSGSSAAVVASLVRAGHGLHATPLTEAAPGDGLAVVPLTAPGLVHRVEVRTHVPARPAVLAMADAVRTTS
ncbi:LysR family transcriptional regulator [Myceligenerans pegani]|uniref:LysR family transcriptional regulator n=1 Tax=Myceligenerans pegani TaxID=2776917 RepID=A0ABR9N2S6_9MICO|nr:LysR family transcriptional regulator [Myceligenerans sp. TRM 65318]MBE1877660.1 LysR family transcriptional regulator [Myceligenerans sp. TRM 65318]MBE3019931.1 LysR family transcriptional regulator [Myceligenerans sp. TRM 65318]